MAVIPLKQVSTTPGSAIYYLPTVFSGGQQYTYTFTVTAPATVLPDNLVTQDMLKSYVANNYQIPNTAEAVVSLWYDYSTLNTVAMIGDLNDFQMVRLLTQNSNGVYVTDKTHGVLEVASNGTARLMQQTASVSVSNKGLIQVTFGEAFSTTQGLQLSVSAGGTVSQDSQMVIANIVYGDTLHPITANSCWVYVTTLAGGNLPSNASVTVNAVGTP